jgi:hypothetical protein
MLKVAIGGAALLTVSCHSASGSLSIDDAAAGLDIEQCRP